VSFIPNPKPGTYAVVDTRGFVPAAIRLATRSPMSHAFVCIGNGRTVEAGASGAYIGWLDYYQAHASHIYFNDEEPLTDDSRVKICDKALQLVQNRVGYGFLDIAGLAINSLTGHYPSHLLEEVEEEKRLICSQLVARCYTAGGIDLAKGRPDATVTPADLFLRIIDLHHG
jgi:hypothetical protein